MLSFISACIYLILRPVKKQMKPISVILFGCQSRGKEKKTTEIKIMCFHSIFSHAALIGGVSVCRRSERSLWCPPHSLPEVTSDEIPINLSHTLRQGALALSVHSSSPHYDGLILLGAGHHVSPVIRGDMALHDGIRGGTLQEAVDKAHKQSMWGLIMRSALDKTILQ